MSVGRHSHHVFELGGQRPVLCHDGPPVGQLPGFVLAGVEHRFDGEDHSRLQRETFAATSMVQHLRFIVVDLPDPVPAVVAHDAETFALSHRLDGMADIAQAGAGLYLFDRRQQCLVSRIHQAPSQHAGGPDEVGAMLMMSPFFRILSDEGMP